MPDAPEGYAELSAELDATRGPKTDRSAGVSPGKEQDDDWGDEPQEDRTPGKPIPAPTPTPTPAATAGGVYGARQLESFLFAQAALALAPDGFLEDLAVDDVHRHVWELSDEDRGAFARQLAQAIILDSYSNALPPVIFPARRSR